MLAQIACLALAVCAVQLIYTAFFKPAVSSIPGPFLAKFTNFWVLRSFYNFNIGRDLDQVHQKYGPVARVGPNTISIRDPKAIESIYSIKSDFAKPHNMEVWKAVKDGKVITTIAAEQDKRIHSRLRKPVSKAYSMTSIATLEPFVDQTIAYFVKRLDEEFTSKGKQCDIDNWLQYFAYDTVGELSFGYRLGFLEAGADTGDTLKDLDEEFGYRSMVQNVPWLDYVFRKNPIALRFSKTSKFAVRAGGFLKQRMTQGKTDPNRIDMLTHFLEAQKAHPDVVDSATLTGYIMTPLLAGSDTTAVVLRSVIYLLLKNKHVLAKLVAEFEEANCDLPPTYKQAHQMPYLEAVVRESMRVIPVGGWNLNRVVPPQGLTLPDGKTLPGGTIVGMGINAGGLDADTYGADIHLFNPDRWMQGKGESEDAYHARLSAMNRVDLSWGAGTRTCLGKNIALLEMYKVIPTLFQLFDLELVDPQKEWTIKQRFFNRQSDMDIWIKWKQGKSAADLINVEA